MAPAANATLLDQGQYLASVRTMYRLLAEEGQSLERRAQGCIRLGSGQGLPTGGLRANPGRLVLRIMVIVAILHRHEAGCDDSLA